MSEQPTPDQQLAAIRVEATVRPVRYTVSCLPEDDINGPPFGIDVEYCGGGRWAVTRLGACLGVDGEWDEGVKPYGRGDDWLNGHRFDLDTALRLAREAAPNVTVNGYTVADALAMRARRDQR